MTNHAEATVVRAEDRPRERFEDPARGPITWFTLFSRDIAPTERMSAGVAELPPGDTPFALHRHAEPEIYYVLEGEGVLTIDGVETAVSAGSSAFIPGDAEHGLRNTGDRVLKLFYVFPVDRFSEVVYRFSP